MYGCLTSAKYHSIADLMDVQVVQNPKTGEINRNWQIVDSFKCDAQSIATDGASDTASNKKFAKQYHEEQKIRIVTKLKLNKRQRITNIRDQYGVVHWTNPSVGDEPTIFEVQGIVPLHDPFGNIIEYEIMARAVFIDNEFQAI